MYIRCTQRTHRSSMGTSKAGKTNVSSPMTTKTMADRSSRCIFQKPVQSCGPRPPHKHHPSLVYYWPCLGSAPHTKQTNTETTAFVSRACGVIISYITTSAWRAPLSYISVAETRINVWQGLLHRLVSFTGGEIGGVTRWG